jgi:intracellular septation protein|uniref:septation protein A n=1 Tax=uncultured Sphingomonas sp. TaxID=158754 RepID=UPI0035C9C1F7
MTNTPSPKASPLFRLAVEYGPLLTFFAVNFLAPGLPIVRVITATVAFMIATVIALLLSHFRLGAISPMLWITAALVLVFGGLTIYFHDERFIKMKPTFVYATFAAILTFGLATGRPLLQSLLETAYPGLTPVGWRKLTINWACFFVVMAVLNEAVWRNSSTDFWVAFKLWGAIPLTLVFAFANIPMLMKHGLALKDEAPLPPAD